MNATAIRQLPIQISHQERPYYALIGVWVLSMISLPIFKWVFGEAAIVWGVNITTLLQATTVVTLLAREWGYRRALMTAGAVIALTWGVEAMGSTTGFPFGHYDYTSKLQPQLLGVPLLIASAWLMMLPAAWVVGSVLANGRTSGWRFIAFSALAMTAWDLFLDPQMVAWDLWRWEPVDGFSYFGIPLVNFLGWFGTAAVVTWIVRPRALTTTPFLTIYITVWLLQTIGQAVFWDQAGPALAGFVGMGTFVGLVIWRLRESHD